MFKDGKWENVIKITKWKKKFNKLLQITFVIGVSGRSWDSLNKAIKIERY